MLCALTSCGDFSDILSVPPPTCENLADPGVSLWLIEGFQGSDLVDLPQGCPPACANAEAVAQLAVGQTRRLKLNPGTGPELDCTASFSSATWTTTNPTVASINPDAAISQGAQLIAMAAGETSVYADIAFRGKVGSVRAVPSAFPNGSGFPVKIVAIRVRPN
jgi:hypothetical protein